MARVVAALLTAGISFPSPAMPLDPADDNTVFSSQWMVGERVAAPWANVTHVEFDFVDPSSALFAIHDDDIHKLERDWPPGPRPKDAAEVEACLKLVADNAAARGPHEEDILTEKTGPAGRLASAAAAAPVEAANCIGVVANACIQKAGDSNGTRIECYEREKAVWDARLNQAYKRVTAESEPDVRDSYQKVQRAWLAYRDARCNHPSIEFKGSMAGPMQAWCQLELTANQALWLERRP